VFKHAHESDEVVESTRAACAALLGGDPAGVAFGPSFTALTMRFAATVVRALEPGDEIVCTRLDHDSNVRPWVIAAERAGARVRFAEPSPETLELPASAVEAVLSERTRWVAVTAAVQRGRQRARTSPGSSPAAHRRGARVYVDAVHATPHRPQRRRRARHRRARLLGLQVVRAARRRAVRSPRDPRGVPAGQAQPVAGGRRRTGGSSARCRSSSSPACARRPSTCSRSTTRRCARTRTRSCSAAYEGLSGMEHVTLYGAAARPRADADVQRRRPHRAETRRALAEREIAVWDGNYYAWELEQHLGLAPHGAVRAGFLHYNDARTPSACSPRSRAQGLDEAALVCRGFVVEGWSRNPRRASVSRSAPGLFARHGAHTLTRCPPFSPRLVARNQARPARPA
jgi:hypothetical protein